MFGYLRNKFELFRSRKVIKASKGVQLFKCQFEGRNRLFENVNIANCKIGYATYIQKNSNLLYTSIGRYCSIADNVITCIGTHPTNYLSTFPCFYYDTTVELGFSYHYGDELYEKMKFPDDKKDYQIKIGNDVWIGSHVLLMSGITIGDGVIIAAGSVVTKSIPSYAIVGGVPARVIRSRFDSTTIEKLERLKWWNKSEEWIIEHKHLFSHDYSKQELKIINE